MAPFDAYLKSIDKALREGNATEHTHRPALKVLLESLAPGITATNEPQRIECGSPDFIVTRKTIPVGYVEAKDVGVDLDRAQDTAQLQRYRSSLRNLILTDYLEFRLFRNGELVQTVRPAARQKSGALRRDSEGVEQSERLLRSFLAANVPVIDKPKDLAERMARMARLLHDLIRQVFAHEGKRGDLHGQYEAFRKVLIDDLSVDQFADMYAQTIAYGMFAARCNHTGPGFTREQAGKELPKTNPFLRKLFNTIAGADLDDRISWAVDDLVELLARADMASILEDFGSATRQEDPVVHFYETFLAAYDPKMREARGVYYTPEPVVSYIVRSVDALLRRDFKLKDGLADSSQVTLKIPTPHGKPATKELVTHRVQILDPACGTGTFLYAAIAKIYGTFSASKGLWPSYVAKHLLPRMYGFELLMAPYAVAHMKLGLELHDTGYDFGSDERLRVFLTNSLEEAHEHAGLPLFAQWLADEAAAASEIKREVPIMVVLGNPPYSGHSVNKGPWIEKLMQSYKQSPQLKKPAQAKWLSDDYVKFMRFAQWRIEQTGYGVLGFVTNHSYLDNPTFLDMRASLMSSFDDIYILNLHGSSKKKEVAPDGGKDENVFDIQQGVAICLMVKRAGGSGTTRIQHADLWGQRNSKYAWLSERDVITTKWISFEPKPPQRLFVPQDEDLATEYEQGCSIVEAMNQNGDPAPGIVTTHDEFAISWTREEAIAKVEKLLATQTEDEARSIWKLCSQDQWSYVRAKEELARDEWRERVVPILYRPFDIRWTVYDRNVAVHRRERVMGLMNHDNVGLVICRQVASPKWGHALVGRNITDDSLVSNRTKERGYLIPLHTIKVLKQESLFPKEQVSVRASNVSQEFLVNLRAELGDKSVAPEDFFAYAYAILFCPGYRTRYDAFLKRGFPRVPLTSNVSLFKKLAVMGNGLINLHLMRGTGSTLPPYPIAGDNKVEKIEFKSARIYINATQYFDGVSESVWDYTIGAYQVAEKWLKDRRGRLLTFDELNHYRQVLGVLAETIRIQADIDDAIPNWPLH